MVCLWTFTVKVNLKGHFLVNTKLVEIIFLWTLRSWEITFRERSAIAKNSWFLRGFWRSCLTRLYQNMQTFYGNALASTCPVGSQIFYNFLISLLTKIIVLAASFQKTSGFAQYWPLSSSKIACDWRLVIFKLYVPKWPPVACKLYPHSRQSPAIFACDWQPLWYNLFATGCQMHIIYLPSGSQWHANLPLGHKLLPSGL